MLRLLIAWRVFRLFRPLLVCAVLAVLLAGAVHGGTRALDRAAPSLTRPVHSVQRAISPLVLDARRALTRALSRELRR